MELGSRTPRALERGWRRAAGALSLDDRGLLTLVTLALAVIVVAATAYVVSSLQETVYGARSQILYDRDADAFFEGARDMETQKELMRSGVVLTPVAQRFGVGVRQLEETLDIEVAGESDVLRLTVGHPDGATAVKLAQAIAASYVQAVESGGTGDGARVVTPARLREDPLSPRPLRAAAAAGLAGLLVLVGLGVALVHRRART